MMRLLKSWINPGNITLQNQAFHRMLVARYGTVGRFAAVVLHSEGKRMVSGFIGNEVPLYGVASSSLVPSAFFRGSGQCLADPVDQTGLRSNRWVG